MVKRVQQVCAFFYRRYSKKVELLNHNALLRTWVSSVHDVPKLPSRSAFFAHIANKYLHDSQISFFEFGVYQGASISEWASLIPDPDSQFFGFDSFEGLPEGWTPHVPQGTFNTGGFTPHITDARISFVKGLFSETLPNFTKEVEVRGRPVVFVDCDLYSSALYVLTQMDSLLKKDSLLLFDDFDYPLGVFKAFQDYAVSYRKKYELIALVEEKGFPLNVAFKML